MEGRGAAAAALAPAAIARLSRRAELRRRVVVAGVEERAHHVEKLVDRVSGGGSCGERGGVGGRVRNLLDIGRRVHLSAPAVKHRLDRLERDGAILGYTAIVDPPVFGWHAEAFVDLYREGKMPGESIKRAVEPEPGVVAPIRWRARPGRCCT